MRLPIIHGIGSSARNMCTYNHRLQTHGRTASLTNPAFWSEVCRQTPFRKRDQPRPSSTSGPAGVMHTLSSLWRGSLLLFCTLSLPPVRALHESEAGVVDWQKTFIGVPRTNEPQVAPSFLRLKTEGDETRSLIVSATETTLGAVDPVDGSIGECRLGL